jgi:hypothetical protein
MNKKELGKLVFLELFSEMANQEDKNKRLEILRVFEEALNKL